MNRVFSFSNIEEIKFTKIGNNLFSMTIKSDIEKDNLSHEDIEFESPICRIESPLGLKLHRDFADFRLNNDLLLKGELYNIPINVQLLIDTKTNEIYKLKNIR